VKPVGCVYKVLFKDRFKNLLDCHLDNLVLDSRECDSKAVGIPSGLVSPFGLGI
jgi:hypothetical protein